MATHWDHLPESRPHPKELAPSLAPPLLTELTLSETWLSALENENSALTPSKLKGTVQERISGLDLGILVKLYCKNISLTIVPEIHSFIQLPIRSLNEHFRST